MTDGEPILAVNAGQENQEETPSVTVVIPTRDRPELLRGAVKAVLGQSYQGSVECIIVFDQSEPVRPDVEIPLARTLRCVRNQRSPGLAGARNSGALAGTGDLLAFCDDDDEWLSQKLTLQVAQIRAHPDASAIGSGIVLITEKREHLRVPSEDSVTFGDLMDSRRMEVHMSNVLVKRSDFLGKIGLVDEDIPGSHGEDYEWLLRAAKIEHLSIVRQPLVRINWKRASWFAERWDVQIAALRYLLDAYPEFKSHPKGYARVCGQIAFYYSASGQPGEARIWARRAMKADWRERRAYLAIAVTYRLLRAKSVVAIAKRFGKGI